MSYKLPSILLLLATSLTATSATPLTRRQDESSTQSANAAYTWKGSSNGYDVKFYQSDSGSGSVANDDFRAFAKDVRVKYVEPIAENFPDWKQTDRNWPNGTFFYETAQVKVDVEPVSSSSEKTPFTVAELVAFSHVLEDFAGNVEGDFSTAEVSISGPKSTLAHGSIVAKGAAEVDNTPSQADALN